MDIFQLLELSAGSVVVESGVWDRQWVPIGPSSHLHTFEFYQERVDRARDEFV